MRQQIHDVVDAHPVASFFVLAYAFSWVGWLPLVFASYVIVAFVGGGNEEPGWRGFALPRLQEQYTPVAATLIVGVVWAFWHLPQLFVDPTAVYSFAWLVEQTPGMTLRVVNIVGFAFLLTWIYNGTGSVLLAVLLHAGINTANSTLVPIPMEAITGESFMTLLIAVDIGVWIVAIVLIVVTRGKLGFGAETGTAATPTAAPYSEER